jgi:hypothetical protein
MGCEYDGPHWLGVLPALKLQTSFKTLVRDPFLEFVD